MEQAKQDQRQSLPQQQQQQQQQSTPNYRELQQHQQQQQLLAANQQVLLHPHPSQMGAIMMQSGGLTMAPMPMVAADPLEDLLGPFPCARLRGLPFEATVDDVLRFFQGLVILDVVMVIRADGRGAGEALVVFSNHMSLSMALSRDKQHMGRRYIEIFQAKRIDYYHSIICQMHMQVDPRMHGFRPGSSQPMHHLVHGASQNVMAANVQTSGPAVTGVLRMRGLPFSATKADVIAFFQGLSIIEDSVQLVVRPDGRLTGEAFVAFPSPADADCAMARNGNNMGSRYVELFPSSPEEAASHPRAL